jgi:hypothetical protein
MDSAPVFEEKGRVVMRVAGHSAPPDPLADVAGHDKGRVQKA